MRHKNQEHLIDGDKISKIRFVVIGAGAIGSYAIQALTKMGAADVTVYDDDTIEEHNIDNQIYPLYAQGRHKVDALETLAFDFGGAKIKTVKQRWNLDNCVDGDVVISAVDDMDVRTAVWNHYRTRPHGLFLEGRMGAQLFRVFGVDSTNKAAQEYYTKTLYPQSEASPDKCGEKSIIYTVLQVAGQMASQVKRYLMNEYRPTEVNYDCFRDEIRKKYHMEEKMEVFIAEDEPVEVTA